MPRFYFNLRNSKESVEDPDGQECGSLTAAREKAILSAREIMASRVKSGKIQRQPVRDHGHHGTAHPDWPCPGLARGSNS